MRYFRYTNIKVSYVIFYRYFYVIVKRWLSDDKEADFRAISKQELTHYDNSDNGNKAYIAIRQKNYKNGISIIVGNNSVTARVKRRNALQYKNAPLIENTKYAIFILVFYDTNGVS